MGRIVVPGGSGQIGRQLRRLWPEHDIVTVSRSEGVHWDGRTLGPWADEIDGCDAVINLAGRSVGCRYTKNNLREMLTSRVDSTRVVGEAIARAKKPPRVWLQMSTATIYAHTYGPPNDEATGVIGGDEPDVPPYWAFSVDIAKAWEDAMAAADTPRTRRVALRTAMVMSRERGGAFPVLHRMARFGLGGPVAGGRQYLSWIHELDLVRAFEFLLNHDNITGPVNLAAPNPLRHKDFMRVLRQVSGMPVGLPATAWMAEIGAFVLRNDTELLLKSRRVVPGKLLDSGFTFEFPEWPAAAQDLVRA